MADPLTWTMVATGLGAGMGVLSSLQQGKAQSEQAKYQAEVARQNQQMAEEQASAQRKAGYENMVTKRQETAKIIGKQRAAAGASGAAVDVGSNLDLQADTAAQGEMDAINAYNKGIDQGYNSEIQAWNYGNQAEAYRAQGESAKNAGYLGAASAALGGIGNLGSLWLRYGNKGDTAATSTKGRPSRNSMSGTLNSG